MYENGKKLNRYTAKKIHQNRIKRKFTPLNFSSYDSYVKDEEQKHWFHSMFYEKKISNGWIPWHRRWWNGRDSQYPWKKNLKKDSHSKERAHYREELAHYDINEDNINIQKKFSDPWAWD